MNIKLTIGKYRYAALIFCLVASELSAQTNSITLEFLPGLASDGSEPTAAMTLANDGALYGSTKKGGVGDHGTIYRVVPGANSSVSTIYSFDAETYSPDSPMTAAADGNLYGVTSVWKKLYRVTPEAIPKVNVFSFAFEGSGEADDVLIQASDGALYGTIHGNQFGAGGIYRITPGPNPKLTRVWTFNEGACVVAQSQSGPTVGRIHAAINSLAANIFDKLISPAAATSMLFKSCRVNHIKLVAASDGNLYGATYGSELNGRGDFIYRVIPGATPKAEILFRNDGHGKVAWSPGPLLAGKDGAVYGTMTLGGPNQLGTVFVIKPGSKPAMTTLMSIDSTEFRDARLAVSGRDGKLYGISHGGANGCGSAFVLNPASTPTLTTLLSFTPEGATENCMYNGSAATLVAGNDGRLYGTLNPTGFIANQIDAPGGIFRVTTGATPSADRLVSFTRDAGFDPGTPLTLAGDGNLYGATWMGALYGDGSVFQLNTVSTQIKKLFSFDDQNRVSPAAALTAGSDGNLYAATDTCCGNDGIVFKVHTGPSPHVNTIFSFPSMESIGKPGGTLVGAGSGPYLYGVTFGGQSRIFRVNTGNIPGTAPIFAFSGEFSQGRLTASNNHIYGSTFSINNANQGTIFELTPGAAKPISILQSFNENSGAAVQMTAGVDGRLYWVSERNKSGCGTISRTTPGKPGAVEILYQFDRRSCWAGGRSELVLAADGALYLATTGNSSNDDGRIFKITTGNHANVTLVGSFSKENIFSQTMLFAAADGKIYGLASNGAERPGGTVFQITPGANSTIKTLFSFEGMPRPDFLTAGKDGYFYGTSKNGGKNGLGTLLRYKPGSLSFEQLYSFSDKGDGAHPCTPLKLHSDGYFYGMTDVPSMRSNGQASLGRMFRFRAPSS